MHLFRLCSSDAQTDRTVTGDNNSHEVEQDAAWSSRQSSSDLDAQGPCFSTVDTKVV